MSRPFRILAVAIATIMLLPCLGFGVFGLLASQEPGAGIGWTIGYLVLDVSLLGIIVASWWWSLRPVAPMPWECPHCGYDRRGSSDGPCAECGAPTN